MKAYPQAIVTNRIHQLRVPWALVVFIALLFFLHSHDFFRAIHFEEAGYGMAEEVAAAIQRGSPLRRVALLLLGGFGAVSLLFQIRSNPLRINGLLGSLTIFFLLWVVLSIAWADDSGLAIRRVTILAMLWLGALAIAVRLSVEQILLLVYFISGVYLFIGITAELVLGTFHPLTITTFAGFETGYRFCGTIDPNLGSRELGMLLISAVVLTLNVRRYRWFFFTTALVALLFLLLSKTRTTFFAAFLSLIVYWSMVNSMSRKLIVSVGVVVVICLSYFSIGDDLVTISRYGVLLGRRDSDLHNISTLTGRIPRWETLVTKYVSKRPLVGYGYGAFWTPKHVLEMTGSYGNASNGYIDLTLFIGLIGAGVYVLLLVIVIKNSIGLYRRTGDRDYAFVCAMFMFQVVLMVTTSTNVIPCFSTFIFISLLAKFSFEKSLSFNMQRNSKDRFNNEYGKNNYDLEL